MHTMHEMTLQSCGIVRILRPLHAGNEHFTIVFYSVHDTNAPQEQARLICPDHGERWRVTTAKWLSARMAEDWIVESEANTILDLCEYFHC